MAHSNHAFMNPLSIQTSQLKHQSHAMKFTNHIALFLLLISHISLADVHHSSRITPNVTPSDEPLPTLDSLTDDKPLTLTIPNMVRFETDGVPVIFTEIQELPILDITLTFKGGSAKDATIRPEDHGIAMMTALMSTQGTTELDETAFAEQAELLGASFGANAYRDVFEYHFRSLSDERERQAALALFADMIANPRFDEGILKRNQAQLDIGFERAKQNPSHLANLAFLQTLYGSHPYATPTTGTQASVASIRQEDLINYKNTYLTKSNAHIAITGDIRADEARTIAKHLSSLLPKGKPIDDLATPIAPKPKHVHIAHDSTQTHVYIGHMGEKNTKDPIELQHRTNFSLGNQILAGGDFNAHLMKEIRDKHGYTYGISGSMTTFHERGYYLINFSTQSDKAKDAILKTLDVIHSTRENGITNGELALERTSRKYAYPMSLATNTAIHHTASSLNYHHLPDSHITDYLKRLDNASLDAVNDALKTYIRPDEFIIITIGKQKPDLSHLFDDEHEK